MAPKNITNKMQPMETGFKTPSKRQNGATKLVQKPPINIPQAISSIVSYFCSSLLERLYKKPEQRQKPIPKTMPKEK